MRVIPTAAGPAPEPFLGTGMIRRVAQVFRNLFENSPAKEKSRPSHEGRPSLLAPSPPRSPTPYPLRLPSLLPLA